MCRVLSVKPSSLDKSQYQRPTEQVHRNHCELLVRAAYSETRERYGYERLHARLTEQGHYIRQYMVRSIKQEYGIKCRRYKRFKVTTESNHNKLVYPNRLDQTFNANRPNETWVSDITYIWKNKGWIYLAGVKNLYIKELFDYAINKSMAADLVGRALNMVIKNKRPSQALIVHSYRGSQYCSNNYYQIVEQHKFKGSMSSRGNCFDNALIESFSGEEHCSARKNELVYHQDYKTRFEAINDIIKYIELEYNEERLAKHCFAATQGKSYAHSGTRIQKGLGYKTQTQMWFDFYRQAA